MSGTPTKLRFGVSITPDASKVEEIGALAVATDAAGLDLIAIQDHPYNPGFLDTWTLVTHLAARTGSVHLVTAVADLALRPAPMLAKSAASLGLLSGGRFELGVGAGANAAGILGMGGRATPGAGVAATRGSLSVLRQALHATGRPGEVVGSAGPYLVVPGYVPGPPTPEPVPVWLGARGPRMLALAGELADGWISPLNVYVAPSQVPARQAIIDEAARAAGRDPADVRRMYNVLGIIDEHADGPGLVGPPELWVDTLTEWALELGFDSFVFWPAASPVAQARRFADEVVPAVRARLQAATAAVEGSQR